MTKHLSTMILVSTFVLSDFLISSSAFFFANVPPPCVFCLLCSFPRLCGLALSLALIAMPPWQSARRVAPSRVDQASFSPLRNLSVADLSPYLPHMELRNPRCFSPPLGMDHLSGSGAGFLHQHPPLHCIFASFIDQALLDPHPS